MTVSHCFPACIHFNNGITLSRFILYIYVYLQYIYLDMNNSPGKMEDDDSKTIETNSTSSSFRV